MLREINGLGPGAVYPSLMAYGQLTREPVD